MNTPARDRLLAYFGAADIATILLKNDKVDFNVEDSSGLTPLLWAAEYDHDAVVKLLSNRRIAMTGRHSATPPRTAVVRYTAAGISRISVVSQVMS
jgi:ankyrin repeat protein